MKMLLGMLIGIILVVIIGVAVFAGLSSAKAAPDPQAATSAETPDLVPSIISKFFHTYKQAANEPFKEADSRTTDLDVKNYYRNLLEKTGLGKED